MEEVGFGGLTVCDEEIGLTVGDEGKVVDEGSAWKRGGEEKAVVQEPVQQVVNTHDQEHQGMLTPSSLTWEVETACLHLVKAERFVLVRSCSVVGS